MTSPDSPPKLSVWIFYATDLVLLAVAGFIAARAPHPLPNSAIMAIVACVIGGAILATLPRLVTYEREKNAALDERQAALEGLSQTMANAAEQISAAAGGLHAIAELTHKNLRHAEQLPHKLQEKITEFQAQLANATDAEKEELEKELATLRASESERLETVSDRIAKSVVEFARLQTGIQKQVAAFSEALAQAPTLAGSEAALSSPALSPSAAAPLSPPTPEVTPAAPTTNEAKPDGTSHPPKRPRLTRREEGAPQASSTDVVAPVSIPPVEASLPEAQPVKVQEIAEDSQPPFVSALVGVTMPAPESHDPATGSTSGGLSAPPKPARKRAEKKSAEAPDENLLDLETDAAPLHPALVSSPSAAADGATRLLITSYIGIGNRLFIRGEGPGLSWEKGVPLQFVSIGKWRWETAEATAPVTFKLYKNDDLECAGIGLQTLSPGHQRELTAGF